MSEIIGTPDDDYLIGTDQGDLISGSDGNDYLVGQGGEDTIEGGSGDDTIQGDGAADVGDTIRGGEGRDEFSYNGSGAVTIDLAAGTTSWSIGPDFVLGATLVDVEDAWGADGDDLIRGDANANRLRGLGGADTLEGGDGGDTLEGQDGGDSLAGGDGADRLAGGDGDDILDGGAGSDVASFSGRQDEYVVTVHYDTSGAATHVTVADQVIGRDGTDTILFDPEGATVERLQFEDAQVDVTCFMPGTLVATPSGDVPVETLRRGDLVLTAGGRAAPVVWMGRQTVSRRFADSLRVLPIRIEAGALGEGLPRRDLFVSPDHALFLDGVLVHAGALVNGSTIRREQDVPESWTYWHVELAGHALVLAEGVAAESFVDNAERMNFDNWAEHQAIHPDGCRVDEMSLPRAKSHRQVPRNLRRRIAARAEAALAATAAAA